MESNRDRNLLFGILAVQLKGVSPAQLVEVAAAWAADPSVPLSKRLVERQFLTEDNRDILEQLVNDAIRVHGGDTKETIQSFGGEERIQRMFGDSLGSTDLDAMQTAPMENVAFFSGSGREISGVMEAPGRYTLVSHHARGGMGRVLIVHDEYLGRNIAMKELLPAGIQSGTTEKPSPVRQSASVVARFLQEARITGQLEHPAIVPVYEVGRREDDTLYYTMRLVRGKTLSQALREARKLEERLKFLSGFVDLCQAIAYSHTRGVIHRDIKPSNVMMGEFGETVVLDWGLAKVRDSEDVNVDDIRDTLHFLEVEGDSVLPKTAYGRALGTPHYMPPEQAEGRIEAIDERSDVYSLGAVLYEILTGTTPHSGKSTREILDHVMKESPAPVLKAAPEAPPELVVICEKALQKDPLSRYQSAAELAEEVQRFITGSLVHAYRYSVREVLSRYYRKHRLIVNTAAACAAAILIVCVCSYVSIVRAWTREHEQRMIAVSARAEEAKARDRAETNAYISGIRLAETLSANADHRQANDALWNVPEGKRGWEWDWLLNRANSEMLTAETTCDPVVAVSFSPDGKKIATLSPSAPPEIWDGDTGKALLSLEGGPFCGYFHCFSGDGAKYAAGGANGAVRIWETASGKLLHTFDVAAKTYAGLFDKTAAHFLAGCEDKRVRAWDLSTNALAYELPFESGPVFFLKAFPDSQRLVFGDMNATQVWDLSSRSILYSLAGRFCAMSPDGLFAATCDGATLHIWNTADGSEKSAVEAGDKGAHAVAFNTKGNRLLFSPRDTTVRIWDIEKAREIHKLQCEELVSSAQFVGHGRFILVYSDLNRLSLWDAEAGARIYGRALSGETTTVVSDTPSLAPDERRLAVAVGKPFFQIWDVLAPQGERILYYPAKPQETASFVGLRGVRLSGDRTMFAALWAESTPTTPAITFHAVAETSPRFCLDAPVVPYAYSDAALSADGSMLAAVLDSFVPTVWNQADCHLVCACSDHAGKVTSIDFAPSGKEVASASWDKTARIWNAETGQTRLVLEGHTDSVLCARFSPDGLKLLTTSVDGSAIVWSTQDGKKLTTFAEHACAVTNGGFSRDGRHVVTSGANGMACVWSMEDGKNLGSMQIGQASGVSLDEYQAVSFESNDRFIVSSSFDSPTRIWDASTRQLRISLDTEKDLHFLDDDRTVLLANRDGVVSKVTFPSSSSKAAYGISRQDFQEYCLKQRAEAVPERPSRIRTVTAVGDETLVSSLELLRQALQEGVSGQNDCEAGISITSPPRIQAVLDIALREGDRVTHGDGTPLTSRASAIAWLDAALHRISENKTAAPAMTLQRGNQELEVEYRTLPVRHSKKSVTVARQQAADMLECEALNASLYRESHLFDIAVPVRAFVRTLLPRQCLDSCGLSDMDALLAVDGKRFENFESLQTNLEQLRQRVQQGEVSRFSQEIRRGDFETISFEYAVQ